MKFRVGPWTYRVRIARKDQILRDSAGRECDGLCCPSEREIWLRLGMGEEQMLDTLFHELAHAWETTFGMPGDSEGMANRTSAFTTDAWEQFQRQGGLPALMRLRPDGVIDHDIHPELPSVVYGTDCPICHGKIAEGEIKKHDGPPRFFEGTDRMVIDRQAECDHCGVTFYWTVAATTSGRPTTHVVDGPHIGHPATAN